MNENNFLSKILDYGLKNIFLAKDFLISVLIFILLNLFSYSLCETQKSEFLSNIISVSAALFSIIIMAFAIITTYTDKEYILAWIEIKKYSGLITYFQFYLYLPLVVILIALFNWFFFTQNILFFYFTISAFFYMIFALFDLVKFIADYAQMRGDLVLKMEKKS
jgi:hypothetical protein